MNELIKVDFSAERLTVSARELHKFLEVKTAYKDWFPRMCQYGFTEGTDFSSILSESTGGRPAHDAALTIDMAKEICMLQRNEKGKQARLYFIQLEKDWNSPEKVMARALRIADRTILELRESNAKLTAQIAADAPRVLWAKTAEGSEDGMLIREFCKFLRQMDADIGEKQMFADLREKGYLIKDGRDKNKPTQRAMELGLFTVRQIVISASSGKTLARTTALLTEKGKQYFANMYLGQEALKNSQCSVQTSIC